MHKVSFQYVSLAHVVLIGTRRKRLGGAKTIHQRTGIWRKEKKSCAMGAQHEIDFLCVGVCECHCGFVMLPIVFLPLLSPAGSPQSRAAADQHRFAQSSRSNTGRHNPGYWFRGRTRLGGIGTRRYTCPSHLATAHINTAHMLRLSICCCYCRCYGCCCCRRRCCCSTFKCLPSFFVFR